MVKLFKNYFLNIFIVISFFLSQVVNVNANHLNNSPQKEDVSIAIIEKGKNKISDLAALYLPSLNHEMENDATTEGKIEKVLEPISIGLFGLGMIGGYGATVVGLLIGWVINAIRGAKW